MATGRDFSRRAFAYDLSKNIITKGEIFDVDVINQSIENILSTIRGERMFLLPYGSELPVVIFENLDETNGDLLLEKLLDAIEVWEDRISVFREQVKMNINFGKNSLTLELPYRINENNITGTFVRNISFE